MYIYYFIPTEEDDSSIMSMSSCEGSVGCSTGSESENSEQSQDECVPVKRESSDEKSESCRSQKDKGSQGRNSSRGRKKVLEEGEGALEKQRRWRNKRKR